jgi:hypothetical protein
LYGEQDKDLIFMVVHTIRRYVFLSWCRPNFHNTDVNILIAATRHSVSTSTIKPTRCTISQIYFILEKHSTCFGRSLRPSSGV